MQLDCCVATSHGGLAFAGNSLRRSDPKQARVSRNPRTLACPDQAMQRHTLHSCGKIPQRDVQPGDRKHRDAIATEQMQIALDPVHETRNALGIRSFEAAGLRRNHLVNGCHSCPRADIGKGIAPSGEACIGRDLDDNHVERGNCRGALPETRRTCVERDTDVVCLEVCDQHASLPIYRKVAPSGTSCPTSGVDGTGRNLAIDNRLHLTNGFKRLAFDRRRR